MSSPAERTVRTASPIEGAVSASNHCDETASFAARDGEPRDAAPNFAAPAVAGEVGRLGKYRVRRLLGRGGMGLVYLTFDEKLQRQVALKVMLPKAVTNPGAKERFLREARAAACVTSDYVVSIYEADEIAGVPYIALQYLQGYPLDEYLKRKGLPTLPQAIQIARETALGLAAAHKLGLVHRDIKPGNLWLEAPHGRVKVLDFGLAKPIDTAAAADVAELTASGALVGTPAYMAPEQGRGERLDGRADLFSLGCVLYRLVTGKLPFERPTLMGMLVAIATEEPTPARQINPNLPEPLADLIRRLMAKAPADRPASADAVARELEEMAERIKPAAPNVHSDMPQVVYVPMEVTVQEDSPFADITEPGKAPGAETDRAAPRKSRPLPTLLIGSTFAAVVMCILGGFIIIKITNKDGSITEIKVPDDAKVEIIKEKKPGDAPKPAPQKAAKPKASERLTGAVSKLLGQDCVVMAEPMNGPGTGRYIKDVKELEAEDRICLIAARGNVAVSALDNPIILEALRAMPEDALHTNVNNFHVSGGKISAAHIRAARATPALKKLSGIALLDGEVSDETLSELKRFECLAYILLARLSGATEKGVKTIAESFPNLYRLDVSGVDLPATFLVHLQSMKLRWLSLGDMASINDASIGTLAGIKSLTRLYLLKTKVTEAGVRRLAVALPQCRIEWDGGVIEPTPLPVPRE